MGFLDGIKRNLNIGGPKFKYMNAPSYIDMNSETVEVELMLHGGGADAHINYLKIALQRANQNSQASDSTWRDHASQTHTNEGQGWDLKAEEEWEFTLPLAIKITDDIVSQSFEGKGLSDDQIATASKLISGIGSLINTADKFQNMSGNYKWRLEVKADVDNVALDPAIIANVEVQGYGQFGGGRSVVHGF
jgi:hypothetical protein